MKIIHYIASFSLPSETFIYDFITNLQHHNIDNYVITHHRVLEDERPFENLFVVNEKVLLQRLLAKLLRKRYTIRNSAAMKKIFHMLQPDIIHAHFGPNGIKIFDFLMKNNISVPLIVSFHGMDINVLPQKDAVYYAALLKMANSSRVLFTSPSQFLKNKMVQLGIDEKKIFVITNAYNEKFLVSKKEKNFAQQNVFKILCIGRFVEVKGHIYLLKAFQKVLTLYPKTTLTLVGDGALYEQLYKMAKELEIEKNVVFIKHVTHEKLPQLIVSHDIYVQPSIIASDGAQESLGVATIEAQVCGLPAIVSNIGGLKEIVIDNVTGKIVPQKNVQELFLAIQHYIQNPSLVQEHARNRYKIQEKFSKEKAIENYLHMIQGIV